MHNKKLRLLVGFAASAAVLATLLYTAVALTSTAVLAAVGQGGGVPIHPDVLRWGYAAAALATGLSAIAAGIAVGNVGAAAIGAIAEKPELFGRTLVFVGLAEGIAIYGLIISIMILNRLT
ncbi:MAG: ATP synthase subunit C [Arenicellales bacterium]